MHCLLLLLAFLLSATVLANPVTRSDNPVKTQEPKDDVEMQFQMDDVIDVATPVPSTATVMAFPRSPGNYLVETQDPADDVEMQFDMDEVDMEDAETPSTPLHYKMKKDLPFLEKQNLDEMTPFLADDKKAKEEIAYLAKFEYFNEHVEMDEILLKLLPAVFPRIDLPKRLESARAAQRVTFGEFKVDYLISESLQLTKDEDEKLRKLLADPFALANEIFKSKFTDETLQNHLVDYHDDWEMNDLIASILSHGEKADPHAFKTAGAYAVKTIRSNTKDLSPILLTEEGFGTLIKPLLDSEFRLTYSYSNIVQDARRAIKQDKLKHDPECSTTRKDRYLSDHLISLFREKVDIRGRTIEISEIDTAVQQARLMTSLNNAIRTRQFSALQDLVKVPNAFPKLYFEEIIRRHLDPNYILELRVLLGYPSISSEFLESVLLTKVKTIAERPETEMRFIFLLQKDGRLGTPAIDKAHAVAVEAGNPLLINIFETSGRLQKTM